MTPIRRSVARQDAAAGLSRFSTAALAATVALAGLVYLNTLSNPFIYDDHRLIVENASLVNVLDLRAIVLHEVTRPLVNLSYAVDRALWGPAPFGFHVTNVLLHMLNVGLLFALGSHLFEDLRARGASAAARQVRPEVVAVAAAALLAVHPLMTEAVGYISGRSEVLCATFFLSALLSARRWMLTTGARLRWLLLTIVLWMAALTSKEIAAMFPVVVLCYGRLIAPLPDPTRRRGVLWGSLAFFGIATAMVAVRLAVLMWIEHPGPVRVHWEYGLVELDVIRRYLTLMVVPSGQTIFHAIPPIDRLFDLRAFLGVGTVSLVIGLAWWTRRSAPIVAFGLLWFLLLLVPSIGLVMLDHGEPMAEHRVYLASCGLFLAAGSAIGWLARWSTQARPRARLATRTAAVVGLLTLVAHTLLRNAIWANPVMLWTEAAERAPHHWLPQLLLGEALQATGCRDEVLVPYRNAIRLRPEEPAAYSKLGGCLIDLGKLHEASATFETLHDLDPGSAEASDGLGFIALAIGQNDEARRHFLATLGLDPLNVPARRGLAAIEEAAGNPAAALRLCEEVRQIAPQTPGNDDCLHRNRARLDAIRAVGK